MVEVEGGVVDVTGGVVGVGVGVTTGKLHKKFNIGHP